MALQFPFTAIVGQDELKLALQIAIVDPTLGGVLVFGDRGTGKSTAIRALASLLPRVRTVAGCAYNADPAHACVPECAACGAPERKVVDAPIQVVDLPLGATEDRLVGALDLEAALARGEKGFQPGLFARAHRGFLYIDEVNLLPDHLVDLLLDVAASGENVVERDGVSVRHPARFVLVGSGNPEEGELRPQLLDRFGIAVDVKTPDEIPARVEIVRRRLEWDRDPVAFTQKFQAEEKKLAVALRDARGRLADVAVSDAVLEKAAELCRTVGTDGLRGELTLVRVGRAIASLEGEREVSGKHLAQGAPLALRHRLRRDVLDEIGGVARIQRAVEQVFAK
jgi:magnesium chelatase subunit I